MESNPPYASARYAWALTGLLCGLLLSWSLSPSNAQTPPRRVFTTHGEPEAAAAMAGHIRERFGWRVDAPQYGERVELE